MLCVIYSKLRDYYPTLDALCEDMQIEKNQLTEKLAKLDYEYDPGQNRFV